MCTSNSFASNIACLHGCPCRSPDCQPKLLIPIHAGPPDLKKWFLAFSMHNKPPFMWGEHRKIGICIYICVYVQMCVVDSSKISRIITKPIHETSQFHLGYPTIKFCMSSFWLGCPQCLAFQPQPCHTEMCKYKQRKVQKEYKKKNNIYIYI